MPSNRDTHIIKDSPQWLFEPPSRANSAIFILICVLPILGTILFGAVDNTTWIIITILWAAIVGLWIFESWRAGGIPISTSAAQAPLVLLLLMGVIQLLPFGGSSDVAGALTVPVYEALSYDPYATRFFISRLVIFIVFFAACLTFINSETRLKKVVLSIIIFGAIIGFFAILQRLAIPGSIYGIREPPQAVPFGPFVNQHHFAALMQMTTGLALAFLLGKVIGRDKKILLGIALVLMSVAAILTSSRGGLLGMVSVAVLVVLFSFVSGARFGSTRESDGRVSFAQRLPIAAAGVGVVLVILGVVLFVGGSEQLLRGVGASQGVTDISSGRFHFWPIAIKIFLDNPLIGAGFDAFGVVYTRYDTWNGIFRVEQAHNEYLQMLAEGGILGFLCVVAFVYILFKKGVQTIAKGTALVRESATGALAGCFGILIHSFFDFPLRTPSNAFFFLMLCSVALFRRSGPSQVKEP